MYYYYAISFEASIQSELEMFFIFGPAVTLYSWTFSHMNGIA